jgi:hypothetical protein
LIELKSKYKTVRPLFSAKAMEPKPAASKLLLPRQSALTVVFDFKARANADAPALPILQPSSDSISNTNALAIPTQSQSLQ